MAPEHMPLHYLGNMCIIQHLPTQLPATVQQPYAPPADTPQHAADEAVAGKDDRL